MKFIRSKLAMALLFTLSVTVQAEEENSAVPFKTKYQSNFYYELDGAQLIPPAPSRSRIKLDMDLEYGLGYSCGNFDPKASFSNVLNQLERGIDELENTVITGASAVLMSLPMYILQRSKPDLVTEMRNKKAEWQEKYDIAIKSCEAMESEIMAGENPYGDWVNSAKKAGYEEASTDSSTDVIDAKKEINTEGACGAWVGGAKAGCKTGEPIRVVQDTVHAGYSQILGIKPNLSSSAQVNSAANDESIGKKLGSLEDAKAFAVKVLGETEVVTEGGNKGATTTPGNGLVPLVQDEMVVVAEGFTAVFDQGQQEESDWKKIESPTVNVTQELLSSYKSLTEEDKTLAKSKLVSEIAFARVIDKALMLRRALLSGVKEPNVYTSPAKTQIKEAIDELNDYIEEMMFEKRIREELTSKTAHKIIQYQSKQGLNQNNKAVSNNDDTQIIRKSGG